MERREVRDIRNTDSYVALQELPERQVINSMAESSQNDIVIHLEQDWTANPLSVYC